DWSSDVCSSDLSKPRHDVFYCGSCHSCGVHNYKSYMVQTHHDEVGIWKRGDFPHGMEDLPHKKSETFRFRSFVYDTTHPSAYSIELLVMKRTIKFGDQDQFVCCNGKKRCPSNIPVLFFVLCFPDPLP